MSGLARLQHARGRRGRSGAAGPPIGGSLHLLDLMVAASSRAPGLVVAGKVCACKVALNKAPRGVLPLGTPGPDHHPPWPLRCPSLCFVCVSLLVCFLFCFFKKKLQKGLPYVLGQRSGVVPSASHWTMLKSFRLLGLTLRSFGVRG